MKIMLNGSTKEIAGDVSVNALLASLNFQPEGTVVERNGDIVDRASYGDTLLAEGDTIELVRFVGGG
ncbi:MAG: hypothetical protein AMXMBFR84_40630 [Candidatus Hydrogenedentota bacterium]